MVMDRDARHKRAALAADVVWRVVGFMAFISGFEFDIFVSYSHVDNLSVEGERWVEKFHDRLQVELFRREGSSDIRIWRDGELDGNQKFDRTLQTKLEKSAVLLCLNSPGYQKSDYCTRERDWFDSAHKKQLLVGDRSRIFNVLLFDLPHANWPSAFQGDSGFPFFQVDRPETEGFPLEIRGDVFAERLHALARAMISTLHAMRDAKLTPPSAGPAAAPEPTVKRTRLFFAKVSDSLAVRKKRVMAELAAEGFEVLDAAPPPFENPAHDEAVEQRIKQMDLAIHLLDGFPGGQIPGEAKGYIQRQAEIGRSAKTPQLIWVPKDLALEDQPDQDEPEEQAYRAFLRELESGSRSAEYDFIRGAPSEITHEIRNRLDRRKPPPPVVASRRSVLLDFHPKDEPYFYNVYQYLNDHGIDAKLNRAADDVSRFESQLETVSALIVFFGDVARDWVLERVMAAARTTALRRYHVKSFGIYVAPPRKPEGGLPDDWRPLTVHPMDNTGGFDPNSLAPLLAELTGP
jgi:TIR domain